MNTNLTENSQIHRPHKSTVIPEMYFHIRDSSGILGTVFFRSEPKTNFWAGAVAFCAENDQPNRRVGRCVARRRYFQGTGVKARRVIDVSAADLPTYEDALKLYNAVHIDVFGE